MYECYIGITKNKKNVMSSERIQMSMIQYFSEWSANVHLLGDLGVGQR